MHEAKARARTVSLVVALVVLLVACSPSGDGADIWEAHGTPGSSELRLYVATCNAELSVEVTEDLYEVTIAVTARNNTAADCLDTLTVHLSSPLGDRSVIDAFDGDALEVQQAER